MSQLYYFEEVTGRDGGRNLDGEGRATRTFEAFTVNMTVPMTSVLDFDQRVTPFPGGWDGAAFNGNAQRRTPRPGDKYVELNDAWGVTGQWDNVVCVDVRADQDADDPRKWRVTAEYAGVDDPLAKPHDVSWDTVPYQEALLEEVETLPPFAAPRQVLNSARDPFAEGVMADADRDTCVITKNVIAYSPVAMKPFQNSVNLYPVFAAQHPPGFPSGAAKIKITAERVRRSSNTSFYWRAKAVVEIDTRGWDARARDAGFMYIDPVHGKRQVAMHPLYVGKPAPSSPQLLKLNGDLADPTGPIPPPLQFRRYRRKDWGPLAWLLNY